MCGQDPFPATWTSWLLIFLAMFFKKTEMQDLVFHFIFTTSKNQQCGFRSTCRRSTITCYYKGEHLLSELQLEGSCVGHGEALQGDFLHLDKVLLRTERVWFGRAEEHGLGLDRACELASRALLGCLVAAGESLFQWMAETWPFSSIQLWTNDTQIHLNFDTLKYTLCHANQNAF